MSGLDFDGPIRRLGARKQRACTNRQALGGVSRTESSLSFGGNTMKIWTKPEVREQEVGLEVTSYLPAEIDLI